MVTLAIEIERKFLIDNSIIDVLKDGVEIVQGYIPTEGDNSVRVRIKGHEAFITLKGETRGFSCSEFEYRIPVEDAKQMMKEMCGENIIEKTRYVVHHQWRTWEVDVFYGENAGLVIAELELESEEDEFDIPHWVRTEVTGDPKYYNACLVDYPYKAWEDNNAR